VLVLRLRFRNRLPLHVPRRVGTATRQRFDVIDHVAGATVPIAGLPREGVASRRAALNAALIVPSGDRRARRGGACRRTHGRRARAR